ncbi:MAG: tetratricopeptide repeat protein, partial [Gammaproteobacteria bacterium]|nr:tetratricopeptide repeat protein [Gammaproteobacteria bacterium]
MIFATKTEFLSLSVSRLALAVFFLLLPAYAHAQDEPQADPVSTEAVDSVDQAPAEVKVFAESIQSTPQTPPDPVLDSSPAADQAASNSDDEEDGIVVSSIPQPENLATDELIDESQKMAVGERYPEALEYALFAVEQEDSPEDPYNPALIGPVINLADIQEKLQLDREAQESIGRAIDLIERDGGIYDARLVEAINDAGRLLQKNGEHEKAIDLFHRSQHIS